MVFATAMAQLRNAAEAEEITQEAFLHCMRKLPQLRDDARFPGWLRRIAHRLAINRLTRRGPVKGVESEVLEIRPSRSRPTQGLMKLRSTTLNQNGEPVQVFVANLLVPRRP